MNKFNLEMTKLYINDPVNYRSYLDGVNNRGHAMRIISNLIPTDTGIEFEVGSRLLNKIDYSIGKSNYSRAERDYSQGSEITYRVRKNFLDQDVRGLYDMMTFMSRPFLKDYRSSKSGIHIHTNLIASRSEQEYHMLIHSYQAVLDKAVKMISEDYFHYGGSYNENTFHVIKGHSIIYRHDFNTLEYRCINMTWSPNELIKHIIFVHSCTKLIQKLWSKEVSDVNFLRDLHDLIKTFNLIRG